MPALQNIFSDISGHAGPESFLTLFESAGVRIERIISRSHASPGDFWYDQGHDEWVVVLRGEAVLQFEHGPPVEMKPGDHLLISRHTRHRVERTSEETVWLAVHVSA